MTSITDAHWQRVISCLPDLRVLELNFGGQFTPDALRIIGEQCRRLEEVSAHVSCDTAALERTTTSVLFPHPTWMDVEFPDDDPLDRP
jgi:hypothetical protein